MEYLLIVPTRLNNLNDYISAERTSRYKGAEMKAQNEELVKIAIKQQMKGWYEKNRRRDLDNISSFGRKVIQDALVHTHVLQNDGWKAIEGFSDEFFVDADNPRIEVLIREV